jgi:hypothetical protein
MTSVEGRASALETHDLVLDASMTAVEGRASALETHDLVLDASMTAVENTLNVSGVNITSVDIQDSSGVEFNSDVSFSETGSQPANFLMDFSGNLIVYLNNHYFRYNVLDVSSNYSGVVLG